MGLDAAAAETCSSCARSASLAARLSSAVARLSAITAATAARPCWITIQVTMTAATHVTAITAVKLSIRRCDMSCSLRASSQSCAHNLPRVSETLEDLRRASSSLEVVCSWRTSAACRWSSSSSAMSCRSDAACSSGGTGRLPARSSGQPMRGPQNAVHPAGKLPPLAFAHCQAPAGRLW